MIANEQTLQEEYDNYIIRHRILSNRERRNVIARYAFFVAARDIYTTLQIARVSKKNHATVIHAWRNHETNMRFDRMYLSYYNESLEIISQIKKDQEIDESKEMTLRKQNAELLERLQNVREELQETRNELYIVQGELNAMNKDELCT